MTSMLVYFAAPLFNENEREFNRRLVDRIEPHVEVFLPQRDGSLLADMVQAGVNVEVAERRIFEQDQQAMGRSNLLIAVLDGAHIDEGVAFEIGFSSALGCVCVGLQTDVRRALPTGNNPMIGGSLKHVFSTSEELSDWVFEQSRLFEQSNQNHHSIKPYNSQNR